MTTGLDSRGFCTEPDLKSLNKPIICLNNMATTHSIKAENRTCAGTGKLNQLRAQGIVPGVVYGSGVEPYNVQVSARDLAQMLAEAGSEFILVTVEIDGKNVSALLKEVQHNALTNEYTHVDFLAVQDDTVINACVPVVLTGESEGVKQGGMLDQSIYELPISCAVKDLPEAIEVDITTLKTGEVLRLGALNLPTGVSCSLQDSVVIVLVKASRVSSSN